MRKLERPLSWFPAPDSFRAMSIAYWWTSVIKFILVSLTSYRNQRPIHYGLSAGHEICQQFDAATRNYVMQIGWLLSYAVCHSRVPKITVSNKETFSKIALDSQHGWLAITGHLVTLVSRFIKLGRTNRKAKARFEQQVSSKSVQRI